MSVDRKNITGFVKRAYEAYFKVKLGDQEKSWAPHTVCKTCVEYLRRWTKGAKTSLKFGIPMVWREPFDHASDCYFCAINTTGINRKNRHSLQYPDLPSARRPVPHCEEIPVPAFTELPDSDDESTTADEEGNAEEEYEAQDGPQPFSQSELNDLVRDLSLSKTSSELLASRLKEKNLLGEDARITYFRRRHEDYMGSHMEKFPENLGAMSDEQGERFHQDMRQMEERYQGRWDAVMMADYCWSLNRDNPAADHTRKSKKRQFMP